MGAIDFELMSLDELWSLHERLAEMLAERLTSEKAALEARLKKLNQTEVSAEGRAQCLGCGGDDLYPVVIPKYRNPDDPSKPGPAAASSQRWLVALLRAGKHIDDFRIAPELPSRPLSVTGLINRK